MASTNTNAFEPTQPVVTVDTAAMGFQTPSNPATATEQLYPGGVPGPHGINPTGEAQAQQGVSHNPASGAGSDGEVDVWFARYSPRNFIGRIAFRIVLTIAWVALAIYTWGMNHSYLHVTTWATLAVVVLFWLTLAYRMFQAHYSHYYRLTNRRLFLSTGVINRRRDMMELLRVKDVFTRQQSLMERWIGLGTVVVVPNEKELPTFYLAGVDDPKQVMDLIWHHARAERDLRSVKVENV